MKFIMYLDAEGRYRWRLYNARGEPVAGGVDGYGTRAECMNVIMQVRQCQQAMVEDQSPAQV